MGMISIFPKLLVGGRCAELPLGAPDLTEAIKHKQMIELGMFTFLRVYLLRTCKLIWYELNP